MKATGIIRRIDDLGRIVIPKELRRTLGVQEGDPMEFYVDDRNGVVIKKYQASCVFCSASEKLLPHRGNCICQNCIDSLAGYATTSQTNNA